MNISAWILKAGDCSKGVTVNTCLNMYANKSRAHDTSDNPKSLILDLVKHLLVCLVCSYACGGAVP